VVGRASGHFFAYDEKAEIIAQGAVFNGGPIHSLGAHPSGEAVVFGGEQGYLSIVKAEGEWRAVDVVNEPRRPFAVNAIAFSSDGARFVAACSDDTAKVGAWDDRSHLRHLGWEFSARTPKPAWHRGFVVSGACFDADRDLVYTTHQDGTLRAWDASSTYDPLVSVTLGADDDGPQRWREALATCV
jgi:WD40 repeat protein